MAIGDYSLGKFAAGPYSTIVVFNPAVGAGNDPYSIGLTMDGFMIGWANMSELLNKTDHYGRALIESFHQGCRMSVNCVLHEWKDAETYMITPNSIVDPIGASIWGNGIVGSLGTDYSMSMTFSALANTPAFVNGVNVLTMPLVKVRSDFDIGMLLGPEHRMIPFAGDVFPYYDSGAFGGAAFGSHV
jgi:hypothetical protein